MSHFDVKPLNASTWPDFAALVERHNGVWGGCWCTGFHVRVGKERTSGGGRPRPIRVRMVKDHASNVTS